jgi:hypothetical protein
MMSRTETQSKKPPNHHIIIGSRRADRARDARQEWPAALMPRPDWSRPLPRPLVVPTVLNLVTLDDVRALIERHLPMRTRNKPTWRYVREKLAEAARSWNTTDVVVALQIALHLEASNAVGGKAPPLPAAVDRRRP